MTGSSLQAAAICGLSALSGACGVDHRQVNVSTTQSEPAGMGGSNGSALGTPAGNEPPGDTPGGAEPVDDTPGGNASSGSANGGSDSSGGMPGARVSPGSMLAVTPSGCGDGVLTDDEACDDRNRVSGDGCSADCLVMEAGFSCTAGKSCMPLARCGDGVVASSEQCDDANIASGDGCSDRCVVELGKQCQGQPSVCTSAVCGNGIRESAEGCDDGNALPFDGCSARCQVEPGCQGTFCVSSCGDGLVSNEECDDGNLTDGDGCSSLCTLEVGAICLAQPGACQPLNGQCVSRLPALFRDFADTHPDFGNKTCNVRAPGALASSLDPSGRPLLGATPAATQACLSSAANFADWYTNNVRNVTLVGELLLFDDGVGGYINRFGAQGEQFQTIDPATQRGVSLDGNPLFFPVDAISGPTAQRLPASIPVPYSATGVTPESAPFPGAPEHNFSFTSELEQRFLYASDTRASLTIGAEDDVWVFLNGRLALDLGGVHDREVGRLSVDALLGQVTATISDAATPSVVSATNVFGLLPGNVYTLSIFHAERKPPLSSLLLQLTGFEASPSQCSALCGDGVLSFGEECDDGVNDGGYAECGTGCLLGPYCGDGITQPEFGEDCDVGPGGDATCRGCRVLAGL